MHELKSGSIILTMTMATVILSLFHPSVGFVAAETEQPSKTESSVGTKIEFVKINPGEFMMGSDNGDYNRKPVHRVIMTRAFEMGKFEVTQAQWQALMGNNPSKLKGAKLPVDNVTWNAIQAFN